MIFQGANAATRITERFTRVAEDAINYEFTVDDPTTWTKPWTAVIPWTRSIRRADAKCLPRGQPDIVHLLAGARARQTKGGEMNRTNEALFRRGVSASCAVPPRPPPTHLREFDANKPIRFQGTVTKMEWINPHAWIPSR